MTDVAQIPAPPSEDEALDSYSRIVTTVAEQVLPTVASLRVGTAQSRRQPTTGRELAREQCRTSRRPA